VGLNYLLKGRALSNLIFTRPQVQQIDFEGATPVIVFTVLVQNTNNVGIFLSSIAGNVYVRDGGSTVLIGNVSNFQGQMIAGNTETPLVLRCRCNIVGVVNEIIAAFQYKNSQRMLTVIASANIDGIQYGIPEFTMTVGL